MENSADDWVIGWFIPDFIEYNWTVGMLSTYRHQQIQIGDDDTLMWATGIIDGKRVYIVSAMVEWHAYAATALRDRFGAKVVFIGGTTESHTYANPPIGHCLLRLPDTDERRLEHLAASITGDDTASLAKLANGLRRFIEHSRQGYCNLDLMIREWAALYPEVDEGLVLPDETVYSVPPDYAVWSNNRNYMMCCGAEFNSGQFTNTIPCLKVLGVRGYRGAPDNDEIWRKYATMASAAAITYIIGQIAV
ncbi:hypothetical protein ACQKWADRAFT_322936 [Trichoderma austrokoningii]